MAGTQDVAFGDYELLEEVGRGAMGVVYRARQRSLDRVVALKMILAPKLTDSGHVQRFLDEARAAARIHHPHVVAVHDVGSHQGQHYLAMEFVEGETCAERLQSGPLPAGEATVLVSKVARALQALHEEGLVHCDLKPSNILIDKEGEPRLTDFGLARRVGGAVGGSEAGSIAGSPKYMAPEQVEGRVSSIGPATDVYCLGVTLYELLTGCPPHQGEHLEELLTAILERGVVPPHKLRPGIPKVLALLCLRCLEKQPSRRYPTAAALADDLERHLRGEEPHIQGNTRADRMRRWTRRHPALAVRCLAILVFLGLTLVNDSVLGLLPADYARNVVVLLLLWLPTSVLLDRWQRPDHGSTVRQAVWITADVVFLTLLCQQGKGVMSALTYLLPFLVVVSGLWFRIRTVWWTAGVSTLAFTGLWWQDLALGSERQATADRLTLFVASLVFIALTTTMQVRRVRALGRFCEGWVRTPTRSAQRGGGGSS